MNMHTSPPPSHIWHPYTRHSAVEAGLPVMVRGEGCYLFDDAGKRYVDAVSSWWCCALGHGDPRIVDAICEQTAKLQHSILGNLSHPMAEALATELCGWMPSPDRHVHFASDGAGAVEIALKVALQAHHQAGHPERTQFLSLQSAYHGDTLGTVGLGYLEGFHAAFAPVLRRAEQIPVPPFDGEETCCRTRAEEIFARHGAQAAALVVEPMCQGASGMRLYPAEFLRHLGDLCRRYEVLLIADEIAMGFGRTGRNFAFEHAGLDPDIVCVGKALSAGALPISAAVVKDALYRQFADTPADHTFYHGHTFAGNPIAAAAAVAALRAYRNEDLPGRARHMEAVLREILAPLEHCPQVVDIRLLGAMAAVELDPGTEATLPRRIQDHLVDEGILIRPLGRVLYLMPPLVIPEALLRSTAEAFTEAIQRVS